MIFLIGPTKITPYVQRSACDGFAGAARAGAHQSLRRPDVDAVAISEAR